MGRNNNDFAAGHGMPKMGHDSYTEAFLTHLMSQAPGIDRPSDLENIDRKHKAAVQEKAARVDMGDVGSNVSGGPANVNPSDPNPDKKPRGRKAQPKSGQSVAERRKERTETAKKRNTAVNKEKVANQKYGRK